ncbi:MAG: thioredoxin family protein [Bdellovibrionota bacterium]
MSLKHPPEKHIVFELLSMTKLTPETFDRELEAHQSEIVGVFFWGHDCPNCEVAKAMLAQEADVVRPVGIKWFHVNTYDHFELGTRFGLFGIPTFLFFHQGKKLGKISPFPGIVPFTDALIQLKQKHG